jgi:hypothetical protein
MKWNFKQYFQNFQLQRYLFLFLCSFC